MSVLAYWDEGAGGGGGIGGGACIGYRSIFKYIRSRRDGALVRF